MNTLREEYESWFKKTYNQTPMPIDGIAHDFCWEGYRAGAVNRDTDVSLSWYKSVSQAVKERDYYQGLVDALVNKQEENQKTIDKLATKLIRG